MHSHMSSNSCLCVCLHICMCFLFSFPYSRALLDGFVFFAPVLSCIFLCFPLLIFIVIISKKKKKAYFSKLRIPQFLMITGYQIFFHDNCLILIVLQVLHIYGGHDSTFFIIIEALFLLSRGWSYTNCASTAKRLWLSWIYILHHHYGLIPPISGLVDLTHTCTYAYTMVRSRKPSTTFIFSTMDACQLCYWLLSNVMCIWWWNSEC